MAKQNKIHIEYNLRKSELTAIAATFVIVSMALCYVIVAYTPLRYRIPGYPSEETQAQIRNDRMMIDSLQRSLYRWDIYTTNLRRILEGDTPIPLDSMLRRASAEVLEDPEELSEADQQLRGLMSEMETYEFEEDDPNDTDIEGRHFFRPLSGAVTGTFDELQHPYIEVSAPAGSSVQSILDGTVIATDWSDSNEWHIVIQHAGGIISIYRNCSSLLKKTGDKVDAGAAVAVLGGNTATDGNLSSLRFEMWSNGESVDPVDFIKF